MINWQDLTTTLIGGSILALVGLIYRAVRQILIKVEGFAAHILECEMRNENHAELHRQTREEVNRRLELLESMSHGQRWNNE